MYDYEAGKADWAAAGLPTEGRAARLPRAGTVARPDVPTCGLRDRVGEVRDRVRGAGWDVCLVVNEERVVLGLLRAGELEAAPDRSVEEVMRAGPSTFRPNVPIGEMAAFMRRHDLPSAPVTTSEGRLVGMLLREDAERAAAELAAHRAGAPTGAEDERGEG